MTRTSSKWILLASLMVAGLTSAACTRSDATGPSDQITPAFENQGSNN